MKWHLQLDAGISGDMFLGACLDLGVDREEMIQALRGLALPPWTLEVSESRREGMRGLRVDFQVPDEHGHRHFPEIKALIRKAGFAEPVCQRAEAIFAILAEAEGAVHGLPPEDVHFHEVGAMDAILDICGAAWAIWRLGVTEVSAGPLQCGSGSVHCHHGYMPVPVPAVVEMVRQYRIPIQPEAVAGETATPTGTAILAHLVNRFASGGLTRIDRTGVGLGKRHLSGRANALRILVEDQDKGVSPGEDTADPFQEPVTVLSAHVDDMNPEWFGMLWEKLFEAGALDVGLLPMTMKKGRPAVRIEVVVRPVAADALAKILLRHSTTLGVRIQPMQRLVWRRTQRLVATPWGPLGLVEAGGVRRIEYEDLANIARLQEWSMAEAQDRLLPFLGGALGDT
ncbi:MAG: nickel pincer cofactor biosynthesis protein LarC [Magnetococcales bacterium]|nr:nickel pincer cofactor biosynthesis protein LarC [Magnetococcales bacterium]